MRTVRDLLEVAVRQLNVREDPPESNNVRYNTWYYGREVSGDAYPWCMAFVQWVFAQAGKVLPYKTASCSALLSWYRQNRPECIVRDPMPGDIILYTFSHTGTVDLVMVPQDTPMESWGDPMKQFVFHTGPDTQFYTSAGDLKEGALLNIYHKGIATRSLPPQGVALEVRLLAQ